MAKEVKPNPAKSSKPAKIETVYVIEKHKQSLYSLIEYTIEDDIVVARKTIRKDLPGIIQGMFLIELGKQQFTE